MVSAQPNPTRVAVIGAGRMGRVHIGAITASSATLTAVVEPDEATRSTLGLGGIEVHADLTAALAAGGFDAAVVAVPSGLHLATVRALVDAGVPTLCEKPCGLTAADAATAAAVAADQGVLLRVGYWRRYVPALQELRREILGGELGEIALAQAWQWDGEPPAPAFRASSGGILVDMGVHEFDQLRWLTGQELDLVDVAFSSVHVPPRVEGDPESALATGRLSGGGVAAVSLGRRYDRGDCCWVEIIGTRASRRCEFMVGDRGDQVFRQALVGQIDAFTAAVAGALTGGATADDAVAALTIAEAGAAASA